MIPCEVTGKCRNVCQRCSAGMPCQADAAGERAISAGAEKDKNNGIIVTGGCGQSPIFTLTPGINYE